MDNFAQERRDFDIQEAYRNILGRDAPTDELLAFHKRAEAALLAQGGGRLGRMEISMIAAMAPLLKAVAPVGETKPVKKPPKGYKPLEAEAAV